MSKEMHYINVKGRAGKVGKVFDNLNVTFCNISWQAKIKDRHDCV
jgi:hypothetical protein